MENTSKKETNEIELIHFPTEDCVYYVGVETRHGFLAFYIGQTKNLRRRIGEYYVASYFTSTDLRVGTAVEHLQTQRKAVYVRFETVESEGDRKTQEDQRIEQWRRKLSEFNAQHLNDWVLNRPRKGNDREEVRKDAIAFIDDFMTRVS